MLAIAVPSTKGNLHRSARFVQSWDKNRTPSPSAQWTKQMAAAFAQFLLSTNELRAGTAVITQFPALLRPSELFSLTWEDLLFPGHLRLQPYGLATAGLLVRQAKTVLHIAQKQFVLVSCPAAITILMDLRSRVSLTEPVFHPLSYAKYRAIFTTTLKYFELALHKVSLHGARGGAAFHAHQKGQQGDQIALIGRWRSATSVAHYLNNAKASLATLKLGTNTHCKLRTSESNFFLHILPSGVRLSNNITPATRNET